MFKKILAIGFIYCCVCIAWVALGSSIMFRTYNYDDKLRDQVQDLWGSPQSQKAPDVKYVEVMAPPKICPKPSELNNIKRNDNNKIKNEADKVYCWDEAEKLSNSVDGILESSVIDVEINLEHRQRGLMWYSTYRADFQGVYEVANKGSREKVVTLNFALPSSQTKFDGFAFSLDGKFIDDLKIERDVISKEIRLKPGERAIFKITYKTPGLEIWRYSFGEYSTKQAKNFSLNLSTNFKDIDFASGSISPTVKTLTDKGYNLKWSYENLLSGANIALKMPEKLNPGPWVAQVTYFAPVSLFLFFFMLFIITSLRKIKLHPMNYFFIGASFFAYHILLSYLVDQISIHLAFWICSVVSIFLVVSYMRLVVGSRFAFVETAISQFIFLVLFSYTFFFKGFTGLAITIMCIVTHFVIMQLTGRLNWDEIFSANGKQINRESDAKPDKNE